jgi:hypothetical protein
MMTGCVVNPANWSEIMSAQIHVPHHNAIVLSFTIVLCCSNGLIQQAGAFSNVRVTPVSSEVNQMPERKAVAFSAGSRFHRTQCLERGFLRLADPSHASDIHAGVRPFSVQCLQADTGLHIP